MNLNKQLSLFTLAINILISLTAFGMERKLTFAMKQRYACLKEIAMKLDLLARTQQQSDQKDKESLLQALEPEEIALIELAFLLTRDSSRPVGRLLKFWNTEERLKEKMKMRFKEHGEMLPKDKEQDFPMHQSDAVGIEQNVMPWEMIAP
jgi:hypothetical protein